MKIDSLVHRDEVFKIDGTRYIRCVTYKNCILWYIRYNDVVDENNNRELFDELEEAYEYWKNSQQ